MSLLSNFPLQVIPSDFTAPSPLLSVPKKQQQSSNYAKPAKDILFIFPRSIATPSNTLLTSGVAEEGSSLQVDSLTIQVRS